MAEFADFGGDQSYKEFIYREVGADNRSARMNRRPDLCRGVSLCSLSVEIRVP